jgi:hypothetical protein
LKINVGGENQESGEKYRGEKAKQRTLELAQI